MSIISMTGVGDSADKPFTLGKKNEEPARFVETTGLFEGIPKGQQVWVTGTMVQVGINRGSLIPISTTHAQPVVEKVTRISNTEPPTVRESAPWTKERAPEPATAEPPAPAPEPEPDPVDPETDEPLPWNPGDHTVDEVIARIEEHPDDAGAILAAERAGKNRKTILREFE